jgi:AraC-like DNA-binding protein
MMNEQWTPKELNLAEIHTEKLPAIEALADTQITVGGNYSWIVLPPSMLRMPFHRTTSDALSPELIEQYLISSMPVDFLIAIKHIVEMLLLQGLSKIELAAEAAGMTVRTLQRRLMEAGISYTQLVNTSRVDIAARWLQAGELSITEIARMLGYSDASNFTRAFRRQTGMSPQAFRETNIIH